MSDNKKKDVHITMRVAAEEFILKYLEKEDADTLNGDFVHDFIDATGCAFKWQMLGAPKCQYLSKTLSRMYLEGKLNRWPIGLPPGFSSQGFPKWVYSYSINHDYP